MNVFKSVDKSSFLTLILMFLGILGFSQNVIWEYQEKSSSWNYPGSYWFDSDGNGYYNIRRFNKKGGDNFTKQYLLRLNSSGKTKGVFTVQGCNTYIDLLPFAKNKLLASGYHCSGKYTHVKSTKVFNKKGNLIESAEGFNDNYVTEIYGEDGYTFFSNELGFENYGDLTISHVDWDFNIRSNNISLESLRKPNVGIVNNYRDPQQLSNGAWIYPFNYGKVTNKNQISIDHGLVVSIKDSKIQWKYPDEITPLVLEQLDTYKNKTIAIFKIKNARNAKVSILNQDGSLEREFVINQGDIADVILQDDHFIVLGKHSISKYELDGALISNSSDYNKIDPVTQKSMKRLGNGDLIVVGIRNDQAVIRRIGFIEQQQDQNNSIDIAENEEPEINDVEVSNVSIETLDKNTISVNVFPNPASLYINFSINTDASLDQTYDIRIIDLKGNQVFEDSFDDTFYEMKLDQFAVGYYFYQIFARNAEQVEVLSGKFVKAN